MTQLKKEKKTVEIMIGQQKLSLKTEESPLRVQKLAEYVNKRLAEILPFGQPVSNQVLMLLAMNLADELLKLEGESEMMKSQVLERSKAILTQIEKDFPL